MQKKVWEKTGWIFLLVLILLQAKIPVKAALSDNPYVTFSPDGNAYTIEAGVSDTEWYDNGTTVETGVTSKLPQLKIGEHYYQKAVTGELPIGKWTVSQRAGRCIHAQKSMEYFHGVSYNPGMCYRPYFSGWLPSCADCGEQIRTMLYYMSDEAAKSMTVVDTTKAYYYKCPYCDNLEQGASLRAHICKDISANKYYVKYMPNTGNGYMAKSAHMYNNAAVYEGREVTPQTTLNLNTFSKRGYLFAGWNTKADGSGTAYKEGDTILNLASGEGECVELYAQWQKCQSAICIDPAGGTYQGKSKRTEVAGLYGETYEICIEELLPPAGNTIHFEVMGGTALEDVRTNRVLDEWRMNAEFHGKLEDNVYTFSDHADVVDELVAIYKELPVILPEATREGFSFGGWYLDRECTRLIGSAGSEFTPGRELTLYAGWVDLRLLSRENYRVNQGKGAVDLSWSQKDSEGKVYLVYQRTEDEQWKQIHSEVSPESVYEVNTTIAYSGREQEYVIPYSGFYKLTLYGAQGGHFGAYQGGKGGKIETTVFLEKGDCLQYLIGGQNGFGGGGSASQYGNGGGCSRLSLAGKGELLIAGGGGGASSIEDGFPGGLEVGIVEDENDKNGACGGGGGYNSGRAGDVIQHLHDENCIHLHKGSPEVFGGCYNIPVYCNNTQFQKKEKKRVFYYGNIDDYGRHILCVRCDSDYCPGHLDIIYCYECVQCKTVYDSAISYCCAVSSYAPGCERNEEYICGMREGEVLSSRAAYGGSNYFNEKLCYNYSEDAGVKSGDGELQIESKIIGVINVGNWEGVPAPDLAPPDKIDVNTIHKNAISENEVRISFAKPRDCGTVYYHQVKSVDLRTNQIICVSNQTADILTSGVAGYLYLVNTREETEADESFTYSKDDGENPFLLTEVTDEVRYLHIAAVDKAGNIGETIHMRISRQDVTYWPLMTEKILLEAGENISPAMQSDTYYVCADSTTPLEVEVNAFVCGEASVDYQIDQMNFCILGEGTEAERVFSVIAPKRQEVLAGTYTYPMHSLQKKIIGNFYMQDGGYTLLQRFNHCKNVKLLQSFTIDAGYDGKIIHLIPQAIALTDKGEVSSNREQDLEKGIYLIADGKGPQLYGVEELAKTEYIDLEEKKQVTFEIRAQDGGSGLKEFYVEIQNMENGTRVQYVDEGLTGRIILTMSEEDVAFHGKFSVMIYAKDRVGNETVEGVNLSGLGLTARIERVREPHNTSFKRGESGILYIQTTGYVEKVEIVFPKDLVNDGEENIFVYEYDTPEYIQQEQREFMVPLETVDGTKNILVKAYKSGTELEKQPQILLINVEGSILDELRTRLR